MSSSSWREQEASWGTQRYRTDRRMEALRRLFPSRCLFCPLPHSQVAWGIRGPNSREQLPPLNADIKEPVNGSFFFRDGERATQAIELRILPHGEVEVEETFVVELSVLSGELDIDPQAAFVTLKVFHRITFACPLDLGFPKNTLLLYHRTHTWDYILISCNYFLFFFLVLPTYTCWLCSRPCKVNTCSLFFCRLKSLVTQMALSSSVKMLFKSASTVSPQRKRVLWTFPCQSNAERASWATLR